MTPEDRHPEPEMRLWAQYQPHSDGLGPTEDASLLDLAAWLDGELDAEQAARIEGLIAAGRAHGLTPSILLEIRQASSAEPNHVEAEALVRVRDRAMALDPALPLEQGEEAAVLWIFPVIRRGLAAAAALGICVLGWQAGHSLTAAASPSVIDQRALASEMTFGLMDSDDSDMLTFEFASFSPSQERSR